MVSAEALCRNSEKTRLLMFRAPNEKLYAIQLFGGDSERMAEAACIARTQTGAECIDINAGCPVPKIVKTGAGSSLTRDPERLHAIVKAVVQAVGTETPVTVKIRSGWDDSSITWKEAAFAAAEAGAAAITLHPRTRAQGYEGKSRWELLAELAELIHEGFTGIPVFGSGDLFTPEAARQMLSETGCDAIMFARGAMGNPFIFTQTRELLLTGSYNEISAKTRLAAGWKELQTLAVDEGEETACRNMRKRFCAYSKGLEGAATLRLELVHASTIENYRSILYAHGFIF